MKATRKFFLMTLVIVILHAPAASALTVMTHYIGGNPPSNTAGAGTLTDIVNAAARMWESAYADPSVITLYFGWAPVGDAGTHTIIEQGGTPNREVVGMILFDNTGAVSFFLDPTPYASEEYRRRTEESQDLGAGLINVSRLYNNPVGDAAGHTDLLSVALHEIGHAMGMSMANLAFLQNIREGGIGIMADLPFAGTYIPLASNKAGFTSHFDALRGQLRLRHGRHLRRRASPPLGPGYSRQCAGERFQAGEPQCSGASVQACCASGCGARAANRVIATGLELVHLNLNREAVS